MRFRIAWAVYRKEIRETLRDRRTLTMMLGLPLVLYPLMIIGMTALRESQEDASEARPSKVAVWGRLPEELAAKIRAKKVALVEDPGWSAEVRSRFQSGGYPLIPEPPPRGRKRDAKKDQPKEPDHPLVAAARPLVLERKVDAVVVLWPDLAPALERGALGHASVLYDSVRTDSETAETRLREAIDDYRKGLLAQREKRSGLAEGFTRGLAVVSKNVAPESRRAGFGLGTFLPFLLITVSFSGAFYAAIDTTAGEKERGTLQTLLCAPLTSTEIIFGKFLSVWTVALVAALANLVSMSLTFSQLMRQIGGVSIAPANYALAMVMLIPITLMVTAIFLGVGVFAKDFKDGQNFLTPVLMGIMLPSAVSTIPGIELTAATAFVPVTNVVLLIKAVFLAEAKPELIFITLLASGLYAALAVLFAARVFERESILLGGTDSLRGLFGIDRLEGARPTPSLAVALFAVCLVLGFYGSLALYRYGIATMLLVVQYGCFLLPAVAVVAALKFPVRETLRLRAPGWRGAAAGVVLGLTGWTVAAGLARLLPPPESLVRALEKILLLDSKPESLGLVLFLAAATPALCEETVFRGLILSGFRRLGMWPAIGLSAVLFGLAHASIYRMLPTTFLGLLFAYAAWKTGSLVPSMIAHALNNGLMAVLVHYPKLLSGLSAKQMLFVPIEWSLGGAVFVALALWLLAGLRGGESPAS